MLEQVSSIILYSSPLAVILPLVLSWVKIKRATTAFLVLTLHLSFVAISSGISTIAWYMSVNNLPLLHIYTIVEFAFISIFFYFIFEGKMHKYILVAAIGVFTLIALVNAIVFQGWDHFNTLPRSIESLTIIIFCIICYYQVLTELKTANIFNDPVFWINTGFLIYFSGSLFLFMMSNYILPLNKKLNILVWTIHAIFSDILYLFIFIGLWKVRRT